MQFHNVKKYVESRLLELNDSLHYHCAWHTLGDVLPAAERLAEAITLSADELIILKTAVLFHDMGFLERYENNELIAADMAELYLPDYDYSTDQVQLIKQLILATEMPQKPITTLEKIICDADLDSLGRDDFIALSMKLKKELSLYGQDMSMADWRDRQLAFLEMHSYHSEVANKIRYQGKLKNILLLKGGIV